MTEPYMAFSIHECLSLLWSELVQMGINVFYGSEFCNKLSGTYLADAFDSRYIVRAVSADGQNLNDLFRALDSVFCAYLCYIDKFDISSGLARLVLYDIRRYELAVVLVRGHHIYFESLTLRSFCHRSDDIVRLESFDHQYGESHCLAKFA